MSYKVTNCAQQVNLRNSLYRNFCHKPWHGMRKCGSVRENKTEKLFWDLARCIEHLPNSFPVDTIKQLPLQFE